MDYRSGTVTVLVKSQKVCSPKSLSWFRRTATVSPLITKFVVVDISIQQWFKILCGPFALKNLREIVRCTSIYYFIISNQNLIFYFTIFLVSINELMERGLVNFEYTKLCFTVGGEATDARPNKIYQSVRVS